MIVKFDFSKQYEKPYLLLANPDKSEKAILNTEAVKDISLSLRFNAISEMSFDIYNQYFDFETNETRPLPYFDLIKKDKLIQIENFGWFVIISVSNQYDSDDEIALLKQVKCYSYEYTLNNKDINLADGTYKLYNAINPMDEETLMGQIIKGNPDWKMGYVDSALWDRYRSFEVPVSKVYGFLMADVEKAYECIFGFDTELQTIDIYYPKNLTKPTDIVLSFENLIDNLKIEETSTDVVTVLGVYGSGDLDIRNVNPTGSPNLMNFRNKMNEEWMNKDLIEAIELWEKRIEDNRPAYSNLLSDLKTQNSTLIKLNGELTDLEGQLSVQELRRTTLAPKLGQSRDPSINAENQRVFTEITRLIQEIEGKIRVKNAEITAQKNLIASIQNSLKAINELLKVENNFTKEQYFVLDKFMKTGVYQNENYIKTSLMTPNDIQDMSMQLLEQGKNVLDKLSQPSFVFSMDTANFVFKKYFQPFTYQLELGCLINVNVSKNPNSEFNWVTPILLELNIDFENPDSLSMTFGNRFRIDSAEWTFSELYNDGNKTSSIVNVNAGGWTEIAKSNIVDDFTKYSNSNFDLAKQGILSTQGQDFQIGNFGIRGAMIDEDGNRDPHQLWINNNLITMTDDNFETIKLAIGFINGVYSVNAEVLAGKILTGNQLYITNVREGSDQQSTFTLDSDGAKFKNMQVSVYNEAGDLTFNIDPVTGAVLIRGAVYFEDGTSAKDYSETVATEAVDKFINDIYKIDTEYLKEQIDKKIETWYQSIDPSLQWATTEEKNSHLGDLWYNSNAEEVAGIPTSQSGIYSYEDNKYLWKLQEIPKEIYDTIDGKSAIFVAKPESYNINDLWIYEGITAENKLVEAAPAPEGFKEAPYYIVAGNAAHIYYKSGDILISKAIREGSYITEDWVKRDRYTDDTTVHSVKAGTQRVVIDPSQVNLFKVQARADTSVEWSDELHNRIWLDGAGNANFRGTIYADRGYIGGANGWRIRERMLEGTDEDGSILATLSTGYGAGTNAPANFTLTDYSGSGKDKPLLRTIILNAQGLYFFAKQREINLMGVGSFYINNNNRLAIGGFQSVSMDTITSASYNTLYVNQSNELFVGNIINGATSVIRVFFRAGGIDIASTDIYTGTPNSQKVFYSKSVPGYVTTTSSLTGTFPAAGRESTVTFNYTALSGFTGAFPVFQLNGVAQKWTVTKGQTTSFSGTWQFMRGVQGGGTLTIRFTDGFCSIDGYSGATLQIPFAMQWGYPDAGPAWVVFEMMPSGLYKINTVNGYAQGDWT